MGCWAFFLAEHGLYLYHPCQTQDQFLAENKVNDIIGTLQIVGTSLGGSLVLDC